MVYRYLYGVKQIREWRTICKLKKGQIPVILISTILVSYNNPCYRVYVVNPVQTISIKSITDIRMVII